MRFDAAAKWILNLGFGAVMVALAGMGLVSYLSMRQLQENARRVAHTQEVLLDLEEVYTLVTDALRGERGYVITGNDTYLRPYTDARQLLPERVARLERLTADNPGQQARLATFRRQLDRSMALMDRVVVLRQTEGFEPAQTFLQGADVNATVEQTTATIRAMEQEERRLLATRSARADAATRRATAMMLVSSIATLLFMAGAGYALNRDMDARRASEAALRRSREEFRALVETSGSFIVAVDPELCVTVFNQEAERLSGLRREDVVGRPLSDAFGTQAGYGGFEGLLRRALGGRPVRDFDAPLQRADGEPLVILWNVNQLTDEEGVAAGVIAVGTEITARKRMEGQLQHDAAHDALTGLLNRRAFTERLHALHAAAGEGRRGSVLFLDLDRFKQVNDTLGHAVGDVLLQDVARRLLGCLRADDTLARLGGDEFAVLMRGADEAQAAAVANRILEALRRPFLIQGHDVRISASVGLVVLDAADDTPGDVLRDADVALYRAKALGRDRFAVASGEQRPEERRRQTIERDLRGAAARGELVLHYQPLVRLTDGALAGFEALVRWQHPALGIVPPNDFIPLAEESGLIVEIGDWVLETSCRQLCAWGKQQVAAGIEAADFMLMISVNFSREQFLHPAAAEKVAAILSGCGFHPSRLVLEITERVLEHNGPDVIAGLPLFSQLGVQLALDDFGTGFSSLSALGMLPLQNLKLDRSFVNGLADSGPQYEVVRSIVELAHRLGMAVVAEGIETEGQLRLLRGLGCDYGQGYFLARPLPADAASALTRGERPWGEAWA
jgi:diguanylate cyclase (GGDEF)-like protein/PAS domain S-box-containing protein